MNLFTLIGLLFIIAGGLVLFLEHAIVLGAVGIVLGLIIAAWGSGNLRV